MQEQAIDRISMRYRNVLNVIVVSHMNTINVSYVLYVSIMEGFERILFHFSFRLFLKLFY